MNGFEYEPGSARLVVAAHCGVLTPDSALATRLWPLIARGVPLSGLLEEALVDGLAPLPDLVLFEIDTGALRVVVRGKLTVRVRLAEGDSAECNGWTVRTWNEQVFDHPVLVTAGEPNGAGWLPLNSGAVLAAGFRWMSDGTTGLVRPSEDREIQTAGEIGTDRAEGHPVVSVPVTVSKHASATRHSSPAAPVPAIPLPAASAPGPARSELSPPEPISTRAELPDTRIEPVDDSFEHLFESTVMRSVEDAAVRVPEDDPGLPGDDPGLPVVDPALPAVPAVPAARVETAPARPGDHDGSTIMAGELAALLVTTGDPVLPSAGEAPVRPAVLHLSTGQSVELDRSVVIGRRPQVDRVSGTEIPHLVTVPSPQQDISRSHVAVRPGVGGYLAVDLGSTNGSVIRRAGGAEATLANGSMLDLQPGDTIDLGDGVTAVLQVPSR